MTTLRSHVPMVLRSTPDGVYIVGGAAGPLGGDDIRLDITVGDGAVLDIHTAAATLLLPNPHGDVSRLEIRAEVGADAVLRWLPEPVIAADGCDHIANIQLSLHPTATVEWRDEVVLGRANESGGRYRSRLVVDTDEAPLLRHGIDTGAPGFAGPAVAGDARAVGTRLLVGNDVPDASIVRGTCVVMPLGPRAALITAVAPNTLHLRSALAGAA